MSVLDYFSLFFSAFGIVVFVMTRPTLLSSNSSVRSLMISVQLNVFIYYILMNSLLCCWNGLCLTNTKTELSLFHRAFLFTKFYLYQRMHLFLSYTKIT